MTTIYAVTTKARLSGGSTDPSDVEIIYTFNTADEAHAEAVKRANYTGLPQQVYLVVSDEVVDPSFPVQ